MFTGYGGLDMAVLAFYGGSLAWYAEVEPAACKVLAAHHPEVLNLGDVTRIDWTQVEPVDAITAGYPCQPFSHAGKRKGKNDERHLWPYVRDAIGALGPSHVVLENVAGHLSMGLADVIGDLAGLGYDARWGVVRASDAGAPHQRARVFIVANPGGRSLAGAGATGVGLPEPAERRTEPAADSGGQRHGSGQGPAGMGRVDRAHEGSARERQRPRQEPGAGGIADAADADGRKQGPQPRGDSAPLDRRRTWDPGTEPRRPAVDDLIAWGKYAPAIDRWEHLTRPAPEPTVPGRNGRPRLSPHFVEWMMGLPAGHVTGHDLSAAQELKMLGNGVVPQQAYLALGMLA